MKQLQFGLKIGFDDTQYAKDIIRLYLENKLHYIELFVKPDCNVLNIEYWKDLEIPIVIHSPHSGVNVNFASKKSREANKKILELLQIINDKLLPKYIVFHGGVNGSIEETMEQLFDFTHINHNCLIENKPAITKNNLFPIGATYDEVEELLENLNCDFCFDIGHAICAANYFKLKKVSSFVYKFLELKPKMFHIADCYCNSIYDNHDNFGNGRLFIDFPFILDIIPDDYMITIETHNDKDSLNLFEKDVNYLCSKLDYSK
jgi:hypothetical protein